MPVNIFKVMNINQGSDGWLLIWNTVLGFSTNITVYIVINVGCTQIYNKIL